MNIFLNASVSEFQKLIRTILNDKSTHEVVIDYDGEVLVDPQLEQPNLDLNKFKVRLQVDERIKKDLTTQPNRLQVLFYNIVNAWNRNEYALS